MATGIRVENREHDFKNYTVDRNELDLGPLIVRDYLSLTNILFDDNIKPLKMNKVEISGSNMVSLCNPNSRVSFIQNADKSDILLIKVWRIPTPSKT